MTSIPVSPEPRAATRTQRLLAGFMDTNHVTLRTGPDVAPTLAAEHARSIEARTALPQAPPPAASITPLVAMELEYVQRVAATPLFQQTFAGAPGGVGFGRVPIDALVAFQPWLNPHHRPPPTDAQEIVKWCIPESFALVSEKLLQPTTQGGVRIIFTSDDPLALFQAEQKPDGILLKAAPRPNWVQVTLVNGMLVLRNGYHRVAALHALGHMTVPAVITHAGALAEVVPTEPGFFGATYLEGLVRKPMVADFANPDLLVNAPHRETKRIIEVRLDVATFNIPK
jgi:hypothetical protein